MTAKWGTSCYSLLLTVLIFDRGASTENRGERLPSRETQTTVNASDYTACVTACSALGTTECNTATYSKSSGCIVKKITPGPTLVGFWPLNSWYLNKDISGNENHALLPEAYLSSGPHNNPRGAYEFMGRSQSYVEIPNNGALDVRYSMTLVMYVYQSSLGGAQGPLFEFYIPGATGLFGTHILRYANGQLFARFNKRGGVFSDVLEHTFLKVGWNYFAASYDYATGNAKIFGNGQILANKTIGRHELETRYYIRIATRGKSDARYFKGRVACVQLYDAELSVDEVFGVAKDKCVFEDIKLKGFWPMGNKYTTYDISGNENQLTLSNVKLASGPTGETDTAYRLQGVSNSYIQIANNGALDARYSFTLALYVRVTSTSSHGPLFEWTHNNWGVHIWVKPKFVLFSNMMKRGGGSFATYESGSILSTNWTFVAFSYNYSSGFVSVFGDGKVLGSKKIGISEIETSGSVRIGARAKSNTHQLAAEVACVQLYNEALTLEDIFQKTKSRCHDQGIVKTPLGSCASNGYLMSGSVESVPDRQLRWSSVNNCARKASLARLNATSAGGYCGSFTAASNNGNQYLQIDFDSPRVIKKIVMMGRYGSSQFVKTFRLTYSQDGARWVWIRTTNGSTKIYTANTSKQVTVTLSSPIFARFLRIRPYQWHGHISFRSDVIGCYAEQTY